MGVRGCRAGFVDPELLGEAVVRIGDTVLAELGERIAQEVGKQLRPTPEAPQVAATPLPPPCRPPAAPQPPADGPADRVARCLLGKQPSPAVNDSRDLPCTRVRASDRAVDRLLSETLWARSSRAATGAHLAQAAAVA